jgi:hypothetical protein
MTNDIKDPAAAPTTAAASTADPVAGTQFGSAGPTAAAAGLNPARALRDLRFHVDKSMRYHQRRRGHFDAMHRWTMLAVVVCGSAAFATRYAEVAGALGALFGALDLVFGYSHKARDHDALYRRFSDLMAQIRRAAPDETAVRDLTIARETIETDEPPIYWLLEADCDNETTASWGLAQKNGLVPLKPWHKLAMDFYRADNVRLPDREPVGGATGS